MKLTTIAVYNQSVQAQIARNALEAEGIWAVIADGDVSLLNRMLTSAFGKFEVQVNAEEAERAKAFLEEIYGSVDGDLTLQVDEGELARQALEAVPEEGTEVPPPPALQEAESATPASDDQDSRDRYARRFVLTMFICGCLPWVVGLGFTLPFYFYGFYLALNVLFGKGHLSIRGKWAFAVGLLIFMPFLLIVVSSTDFFGIRSLIRALQ